MDKRFQQRRKVLQAAGAAALLGAPAWAWAQGAYPNRPIKILVPFPPGNTIDIVVRLLQNHMAASLG